MKLVEHTLAALWNQKLWKLDKNWGGDWRSSEMSHFCLPERLWRYPLIYRQRKLQKPNNIRNSLCKTDRTDSCGFIKENSWKSGKNWSDNWQYHGISQFYPPAPLMVPPIPPYISLTQASKTKLTSKLFYPSKTFRTNYRGSKESRILKTRKNKTGVVNREMEYSTT